jgi:hypothetical protein
MLYQPSETCIQFSGGFSLEGSFGIRNDMRKSFAECTGWGAIKTMADFFSEIGHFISGTIQHTPPTSQSPYKSMR